MRLQLNLQPHLNITQPFQKINTVTNSDFIMSKPLHIPRFDTENQEPQFRRIELLIQLRNFLLDYYNFLYDISH